MATGIPIAVGELIDTTTINTWARGYLRKTTAKTVASTTGANDLLNGEFVLPAGAMGTDKIVRLSAWGDFKNDSGAPRDVPTFRLILGSTTLLDTNNTGTAVVFNTPTRNQWKITAEIQNLGAANSQFARLTGRMNYAPGASSFAAGAWTTGTGVTFADGQVIVSYDGGHAGLAVDTTASCNLKLNVLNAFSDANYETKLYGALCEVI